MMQSQMDQHKEKNVDGVSQSQAVPNTDNNNNLQYYNSDIPCQFNNEDIKTFVSKASEVYDTINNEYKNIQNLQISFLTILGNNLGSFNSQNQMIQQNIHSLLKMVNMHLNTRNLLSNNNLICNNKLNVVNVHNVDTHVFDKNLHNNFILNGRLKCDSLNQNPNLYPYNNLTNFNINQNYHNYVNENLHFNYSHFNGPQKFPIFKEKNTQNNFCEEFKNYLEGRFDELIQYNSVNNFEEIYPRNNSNEISKDSESSTSRNSKRNSVKRVQSEIINKKIKKTYNISNKVTDCPHKDKKHYAKVNFNLKFFRICATTATIQKEEQKEPGNVNIMTNFTMP